LPLRRRISAAHPVCNTRQGLGVSSK
jgi:hypothetical protein